MRLSARCCTYQHSFAPGRTSSVLQSLGAMRLLMRPVREHVMQACDVQDSNALRGPRARKAVVSAQHLCGLQLHRGVTSFSWSVICRGCTHDAALSFHTIRSQVSIMMWYLPGMVAVKELDALQSALGLIGTSLFLLQAFRVNSSYGEVIMTLLSHNH